MSRATETFPGKNTSSPLARKFSRSCLIWASLASCAEMARALVLHLLLAGAAAMPTHGTSEVDDPIAGHLHDRADASDHATSHSHHPRPIDEEVADAHDQHALTPPALARPTAMTFVTCTARRVVRAGWSARRTLITTVLAAHPRAPHTGRRLATSNLSAARIAATSRSGTRMSNNIKTARRCAVSTCARALVRARLIAPSLPCS